MMIKKYTQKEFQERFDDISHEYELLSEYITMHDPITVKHLATSCKNPIFTTKANSIINNGTGCPSCFGVIRPVRTNEEFEAILQEKKGPNYRLVGEYTGCFDPVTIEHTDDYENTHRYVTTSQRCINQGQRCTVCYGKTTPEKFRKRFDERRGPEYTLLSEWTGPKEDITFRHESPECDYAVSSRKARDAMNKSRAVICRVCAAKRLKDYRENIQRSNSRVFKHRGAQRLCE